MLLGTTFLISYGLDIPVAWLMRDPSMVTGDSPFVGFFSNVCVLLWCAIAAVCFFCFLILRKTSASEGALFFLFTGVITLVLMLDDFFLIHEYVFPILLGLSELVLFAGYGLATVFVIIRFRKFIQETNLIFLLLALGFFGLSLGIDLLNNENLLLLEDGAKLLGIVSWFGYFVTTGVALIRPMLPQQFAR